MKTRTLTVLATLAVALVAGGAAIAPVPVRAQAKPIVWNLPTVAAPTYYHTVNYNAWAAKVKEKSGGRMEIRIHPASSLYPSAELIPAVLDGRSARGARDESQPRHRSHARVPCIDRASAAVARSAWICCGSGGCCCG